MLFTFRFPLDWAERARLQYKLQTKLTKLRKRKFMLSTAFQQPKGKTQFFATLRF